MNSEKHFLGNIYSDNAGMARYLLIKLDEEHHNREYKPISGQETSPTISFGLLNTSCLRVPIYLQTGSPIWRPVMQIAHTNFTRERRSFG